MQNSKGHISAIFEKLVSFPFFLCRNHFGQWVFFVAQAHSIYHCLGSGIWARHDPEAKHSGQRLIPKPRVFLISCGWKIYSCCNSKNTTEDNNPTKENMCKFQYCTEEFAILRVIPAILFSKDNRCTGQAQMSWISGDVVGMYPAFKFNLFNKANKCCLLYTSPSPRDA